MFGSILIVKYCKRCVLLLGMLFSVTVSAVVCHPNINPNQDQYLIGYGSLMDEESKKRTDPTAKKNIPVVVRGYQRFWGVHGDAPGLNATFLSVRQDKNAFFNGVMYQLSHSENIQKYDAREKVYCRRLVPLKYIETFGEALSKNSQVWIYISEKKKHRDVVTPDFPVVQSYVDLFIRGCIQLEEKYQIKDFAKQCVLTTAYWPEGWVNDRVFPRRPSVHEPYAYKIDHLLKELIPEKFKKVKER